MYTVYADDVLIHDGASPDINVHLIDPNLTIGDSVAGSFDMTMAPDNPGYDYINRFTTLITVKREGKVLWVGRAIQENEDFWNRRKLTCEGALAFLNDTNQEMRAFTSINLTSFIATLLDFHNTKVAASHQFHLGMITVEDLNDDHLYQTEYKNTWEEFKANCLDRLGGHVRLRYEANDPIPYFDYLKDYPNTAAQEINFGENLLDFTRDWDLTDLCTVLIPRGKQLDEDDENGQRQYVTVASVNNNSIYVFNQEAYNRFGRIEQTVDFSEVEEPSILLQLAQTYISIQQFDQMSMKVNAVDLHRLTVDKTVYVVDSSENTIVDSFGNSMVIHLNGIHDDVEGPNPLAFSLLDEVRCISHPHGLDRMFPITEIQIPLDKPEGVTYTMGTEGGTTMSGVADKTSMVLDRIKNLPSTRNILGLAKQQAAQILNQRTTGYVTITEVAEKSQAIIISNTADWENSTKRWMWNINGLGYTKDGGQTYDIAMTMDGTIVADFIKTGILEDGYGLNYWNLSTGEFSLSYNTEFQDTLGNVMTIVDVNTLAQQAEDNALAAGEAANTVNTKVETEKKKQAGSTNLINGTNVLAIGDISDNNWALGEWAPTWSSLMGRGETSTIDVTDAPNKKIIVGVRFRSYQTVADDNGYRSIMQGGVPLGQEQVYCISCYAKGTGKLRLMVGKLVNQSEIDGGAVTGTPMYATATKSVTSDWRRYHLVFATGRNDTYEESNYIAGILNGRVDVHFGLVSEQGSDIRICGMKLERGNDPTDWGESDFDTQVLANGYTDKTAQKVIEASYEYADAQSEALQTFTRDYVEAISDHDREFTKQQRQALDESFNQYKILQRLTQNFTRKGIYLQNNELYVNASYIRTGTLDAGIVKTGILTDHAGKNKWNMTTGYLYTRNMEAVNAKLDGIFTCGGTYSIQLADGILAGYQNKTYVGSIDYSANVYDLDSQTTRQGLCVRAKGIVEFRTPYISVRRKNDNGISTRTYSGTKRIRTVSRVSGGGSGGIDTSIEEHGIEVVNGLVTAVW